MQEERFSRPPIPPKTNYQLRRPSELETITRTKDYLKYWRVVKKYAQHKFGLGSTEIDMLLFLYSEKYFTRQDFGLYYNVIGPHWFVQEALRKWIERGIIEIFREHRPGPNGYPTLYKLSRTALSWSRTIYSWLEGTQNISIQKGSNPWVKNEMSRRDRAMIDMIERMREDNVTRRKKNHNRVTDINQDAERRRQAMADMDPKSEFRRNVYNGVRLPD